MATVPRERLTACDGFRVESPNGRLGRVEETWLGADGEPAALAVRALDGQRGLLLSADVEAVLADVEAVVVRPDARLLELDAPRVEDTRSPVRASWATTGGVLEPRPPLPLVRDRPVWQIALLLYAGIVLLAAVVITAAFAVAQALA
jgi:hypothetical protein